MPLGRDRVLRRMQVCAALLRAYVRFLKSQDWHLTTFGPGAWAFQGPLKEDPDALVWIRDAVRLFNVLERHAKELQKTNARDQQFRVLDTQWERN